MKNRIILEKVREKRKLLKGIADTTTLAKMAWISSFIDLISKYKWTINNTKLDVAKKWELTRINKYLRYIG